MSAEAGSSSDDLRQRVVQLEHELGEARRLLAEAEEQQAATGEILRVIAASPTDLPAVLEAVAENAARVCGANDALIFRVDGDALRVAAQHGAIPVSPGTDGQPITRGSLSGRAVLDRGAVHVADIEDETGAEFPLARSFARVYGIRTHLAAPLLREGTPIGAILIRRTEVRPFSDQQIRLLETFADQAVIAIENTRLFQELQERNRDLTEALEQQTATSEVLDVIASSPTDLQPVVDTILSSAARLCGAHNGAIFRFDGEALHALAYYNVSSEFQSYLEANPPRPGKGSALRQATLEKRVVHILDVLAEPELGPAAPAYRSEGMRTVIAVPLLKQDTLIGAITMHRLEVRPFTEQQIRLLETFADQAVIAVENVRLFQELQGRNRDLSEALEQQTATGEILRVIARSPTDVQPVLDALIENAIRLCGAERGFILRFDGEVLRAAAAHNVTPELLDFMARNPISPGRHSAAARAALERRTVHIDDVWADPEYTYGARDVEAHRTVLGIPMLRGDDLLGVIIIFRHQVRRFSDRQIDLMETFADQAVIAIENTRLFQELQERNRDLSEALEQQTATSEMLRVISSSPTELQPVLDAVAENAARLCGATDAVIRRLADNVLRYAAGYGPMPAEEILPVSRDSFGGRAVVDRQTVHSHDLAAESEAEYPVSRALGRRWGHRTALATPLLRQGVPIGVIIVRRLEMQPFTDKQIALLETFADQAVIAIENTRLFQELSSRVEELQALGEIGRAVGSSLDLERVLSTITAHAVELSAAEGGAIYEYDEAEQEFHFRATHNVGGDEGAALPMAPLRLGEGAVGMAGATLAPVQIADIATEGAYGSRVRGQLVRRGYRALLAVPLLADERLLGGIVVARKRPGEFSPGTVELLQTFASQSALAIQNARLFREIDGKSRQLEVVSKHKSEFLASMSHELRTPLNAIIGFSEVLVERMFGELNEKQEDYLGDILSSGRHLLSLINDILDLSKVEAGQMELELGEFSLREALENGLTMLKERASRHGIALQLDIEDGLDQIEADERKVKQVVFNLLSNAVKFTPDGGRIEVSARREDNAVVVAVRDTGIGIAAEDLERVFEEFQQVGAGTAKAEGTGLGLALTRKLLELHGGRIWLESEPGVGSTFSFSLPGRTAEASLGAAGSVEPVASSGGGQTVLLVEDDPRAIELLTLHLKGAGFDVAVARDGVAGLDLARRLRPAAISLDISLPRLDGWDFLARAKADPALAGIPVVIVSMIDERGRGFALGAADYLVKPVKREELIAALQRVMPDAGDSGEPSTVLAIDDDPLAVELVEAVLTPRGYRVLKARDGQSGLELARRERPDLVILDLLMPGLDGFAVVEALRADPATADIPIVILTSKSMTPEDKARLNGHISHLAQKGAFDRAGFLDLVRRFAAAPVS